LSLLYSGKTTQIPQFCADYAFPLENAPTTQNNGKSKNSNSDSKKRPHETEVSTENFEEASHQFQNKLKSNEENMGNNLGKDINVSIDNKEISNERTAPSVSTVQPTRIVAVTQPRRVAAVTVAQRVAAERAGM
jgi:recombination DNA repair RAD52 pathway protein